MTTRLAGMAPPSIPRMAAGRRCPPGLPGATATDFHPGASHPEQSKEIAKSIALGRVGQPDDIADVIGFLASDRSRWVTGQKIDTSGGQRI